MRISISCVAAHPVYYEPCLYAIEETIKNLPTVSKVYWCSDIPLNKKLSVPVVFVKVKPYVRSTSFDLWYNYISLRLLPAVVDSDYDVIVSQDGYAINRNNWTDEFFSVDYIGAVWPHMVENENVGNGGFSWRSRKLYDALIDSELSYLGKDWPGLSAPHYHVLHDGTITMPEDVCIASPFRKIFEKHYNLRYPNVNLANKWSLEYITDETLIGKSFGFHGPIMKNKLNLK